MKLYLVLHSHRHGISTAIVPYNGELSNDQAVAEAQMDYDPDDEENLEVEDLTAISTGGMYLDAAHLGSMVWVSRALEERLGQFDSDKRKEVETALTELLHNRGASDLLATLLIAAVQSERHAGTPEDSAAKAIYWLQDITEHGIHSVEQAAGTNREQLCLHLPVIDV